MDYQDFMKMATFKALNVSMPYHKGEEDPFYQDMLKVLRQVYLYGHSDGIDHAHILDEEAMKNGSYAQY